MASPLEEGKVGGVDVEGAVGDITLGSGAGGGWMVGDFHVGAEMKRRVSEDVG